MSGERRPELVGLEIADSPDRWSALDFDVVDGRIDLGGVRVRLGAPGHGIVSWTLRNVEATDIDGLTTFTEHSDTTTRAQRAGASTTQKFGGDTSTTAQQLDRTSKHAKRVDHLVVVSPDFDRTSAALAGAGLPLRRIRDAGGFRQGFRRLGPAILELVEARDAPAGPAAFWGLVVTVTDLDELAFRLGDRLGTIREAVQPGRRIATLRPAAGLGPALAFMDPETPGAA